MKARLRENIVNKHKGSRKYEVELSAEEISEWRRSHDRAAMPPKTKWVEDVVYIGKKGDILPVFTGNKIGFTIDEIDIFIVEDKEGVRHAVRRELIFVCIE